jgi:hypothetical protein
MFTLPQDFFLLVSQLFCDSLLLDSLLALQSTLGPLSLLELQSARSIKFTCEARLLFLLLSLDSDSFSFCFLFSKTLLACLFLDRLLFLSLTTSHHLLLFLDQANLFLLPALFSLSLTLDPLDLFFLANTFIF